MKQQNNGWKEKALALFAEMPPQPPLGYFADIVATLREAGFSQVTYQSVYRLFKLKGGLTREYIIVLHRGEYIRVSVMDIAYFQADMKYLTIKLFNGKEYTATAPLKVITEKLGDLFIKIHRGTLVSNCSIVSFRGRGDASVKLTTGDVLSVSRRFSPKVREYFKSYQSLLVA